MFSFRTRFATLSETMKIYPITTAILGVICTITLLFIWERLLDLDPHQMDFLGKLLLIGFVYVFASAAVTKRFGNQPLKHMLWQGLLLVGMIAYFLLLPTSFDDASQSVLIKHVLIQITAIVSLLVLALWTDKRNDQSMYHGVIQLVLHAVLAGLFSFVLAGGIMGALWGIEQLFTINIVNERYPTIFSVVGILFGGLSFLDGVRKWKVDEEESVQPAKWKTLLGWVVGFLLLVYGIILYIYLGKVIVTGKRPSNQVTPLSFAFSGLVVLGSILLVPLVADEEHVSLRKKLLTRMYLSLIPILGMVFFAIKLRIEQYGVTEMRYILCALLVWLLISAGYMIWSRKKDLRWVAALFSVIAIISFAGGPLSASGIAKTCQSDRLENFIVTYTLKDNDGLLDTNTIAALSNDEKQEMAELIRYLIDYHGPQAIKDYYKGNTESAYMILEKLGLPTTRVWNTERTEYIYVSARKAAGGADISGYTRLYNDVFLYGTEGKGEETTIGSGMTARINGSDILLTIDETEHVVTVDELIEKSETYSDDAGYRNDRQIDKDDFVYVGSGFKLLFGSINGQKTSEGVFILGGAEFDLLE